MPSKKYNLVGEDSDPRVPLVPEEAFQNGIPFNVKFIGAMDIPRPTSRVEIVAAMRRVRFEFKAKGIKKRKVTVTISTDGIRTCVRKKGKGKKNKLNGVPHPLVDIVLESHPIYRIFYVSHDSQDVKIFSYIARETSSSVFHCVVFKASNKNQAMKVVRTVGQAFEVSHKLNGPFESSDGEVQEQGQESSSQARGSRSTDEGTLSRKKNSADTIKTFNSPQKKVPPPINVVEQLNEFENDEYLESPHNSQPPTTPILKDFTGTHEVKLLREKLEQSTQATNAALAQITLLRDQLQAESAARIEAQARTHQLLQHNKELLDHLQSLVNHINELEGNVNIKKTSSTCSISPAPLPQVMSSSFQEIEALRRQNAALLETILYENNRISYQPHPYHYMYPPPPPGPPPAAPLYSSLLINNPHIPYNPQQQAGSSAGSSPNKFYEDFTNMFTRAASQPPSSQTAAAVVAAAAAAGVPAPSSAILDSVSVPGTPRPGAVDAASINRLLFERQMSPMRRPHGFGETGPTGSSAGLGGNGVQRSVSEKINHRSELMSQVQRSIWARHTTK